MNAERELLTLLWKIAEALERIAKQLERWDYRGSLVTTTYLEKED